MGKYIKEFQTHSAYNTYINGEDALLPNVSYCVDNDEHHYNPIRNDILTYTASEQLNLNTYDFNPRIKSHTFENGVGTVEFEGNLVTIGTTSYSGFYAKNTLTSIKIPNTVTTIGQAAFYNCNSLTSITIPDSVTNIGGYAFQNCSGLTNVTLSKNIVSLNNGYTFSRCTALTSINVDIKCGLGREMFSYCQNLSSITIGNNVTSIGQDCFWSCYNLTGTLNIPDSVTHIYSTAFYGCSAITNIIIGTGLTNIVGQAFYTCSALETVTIKATTPPDIYQYAFPSYNSQNVSFYVPAESINTYKAASVWSNYADRIFAIPTT